MIRKSILILMGIVLLSGCGTNEATKPSDKSLYEGLNGKETYVEAVKFLNQNVTYYKSESSDSGSHSYNEYFQLDDGISTVTKALYSDAEATILNYNIVNGSDYHTLYQADSVTYKYNMTNDYTQKIESMYTDISQKDNYNIIEVNRKNDGDFILLEMKVQKSQRNQEADETDDIGYYIDLLKINKDGYICEEKITYYTDDTFSEVSYEGLTTLYTDFNKKKATDFATEIELMKSCDGLNEDEVKDKIGLQW